MELVFRTPICFNQSETLSRSLAVNVISMEFLQSLLRRHFAGKPVVATGKFLRPPMLELLQYLTIIPRSRMSSESIAHEAEGRMGF